MWAATIFGSQWTGTAMEKSMFAATFIITQSLPVSGVELQYRVKNTVTGHERVAAEGEDAQRQTGV